MPTHTQPVMTRRALAKTESAIRASDPRLASILDIFGRLNRDEEMPRTEQLPGLRGPSLRWLPRSLATRRALRARTPILYAVTWFYVLVVMAWASRTVVGASSHSASCPAVATVNMARLGTYLLACKLAPGRNLTDLAGRALPEAPLDGPQAEVQRAQRPHVVDPSPSFLSLPRARAPASVFHGRERRPRGATVERGSRRTHS